MHQRCLEVVDMHAVRSDIHGKIVGLTVGNAWSDSPARHPNRERVGVMISPPTRSVVDVSLDEWGPAEFTSPNDECVVQQSTLSQIGN